MKKIYQYKEPTADAQRLKRCLLAPAKRIGRRKTITAAKLFALMFEIVQKTP